MKKYFYLAILLVGVILYIIPKTALADPKFARPTLTLRSPVYYNYYDNDTSSNIKNYNCFRDTTYNGHKGTDFKAEAYDQIISGAYGGVYFVYESCPFYGYLGSNCGNGFGNHAKIDHEGNLFDGIGWVTIYGHMAQAVYPNIGTLVGCRSFLGWAASSGSSNAVHLHFEVKKYSYPNNDPFAGPCSGPVSFWVNQNGGVPTTQCQ